MPASRQGLPCCVRLGRHAAPIPAVAETMVGALLCHRGGASRRRTARLPCYALPDGELAAQPAMREDIDAAILPRVPWARFVSAVACRWVRPAGGLALCEPV